MNWAQFILVHFSYFILAFYISLYAVNLYLVFSSAYDALRQPRRLRLAVFDWQYRSLATPPITVLMPAYNEEATVVESVRALLGLRYPRLEVIVVNDGSDDNTLDELIRSFSLRRADLVYEPLLPTQPLRGTYLSTLDSRLLVIDKARGGKSDALNAGINLARTPWVCSVDADSVLEEDALLRVIRPVVEDARVVASSGVVRVVNGCQVAGGRVTQVQLPRQWLRGWLVMIQVVEYLRGFIQGRLGWSWLNGVMIIAGAFGVFRTDVLRQVGGYSSAAVTEDMEVVVRIHRHLHRQRQPYRIVFVPDPVCWTEVPSALSPLARQRRRWHRGLAQVLWLHRDLFFRPYIGLIGFFVLPYFVLELVAPLVEVLGYAIVPVIWALGWLSGEVFLLYLTLAFLLGIFLSLWAVLLEEFSYRRYASWKDLFKLLLYALMEFPTAHLIVVTWRLQALYQFLRGRGEWGLQQRIGFRARLSSS